MNNARQMHEPFPLPERLQFGPGKTVRGLTVFPLFEHRPAAADYVHNREALEKNFIEIEEVSDSGVVAELLVRNRSGTRVLFLEAEQLDGGKQNRVVNLSLVVPPGETHIPVSCVEQGRWSYRREKFVSCEHTVSSQIRSSLKRSVTASSRLQQSYRSDQSRIWRDVEATMVSHREVSETSSLSDLYARRQKDCDDIESELPYMPGATGLALGVAGRVVSIDLFDRPETCRSAWTRLIAGVALDAIVSHEKSMASPDEIRHVFEEARTGEWEQTPSPGEGHQLRGTFSAFEGSILVVEGQAVHSSFVRKEPVPA